MNTPKDLLPDGVIQLLNTVTPETNYEDLLCRMCREPNRNPLNLIAKESLANGIYEAVCGGRKQSKVSLGDCFEAAEAYNCLRDFANYGVDGFSARFGLGKAQVQRLRALGDAHIQSEYSKYNGTAIKTWRDAATFFSDKFENAGAEYAVILYLDEEGTVAGTYTAEGARLSVSIDLSFIRSHRPYLPKVNCIIAHNHPHSSAKPSTADYGLYAALRYFLTRETKLLDCLIAAENTVFSMEHNLLEYFPPQH